MIYIHFSELCYTAGCSANQSSLPGEQSARQPLVQEHNAQLTKEDTQCSARGAFVTLPPHSKPTFNSPAQLTLAFIYNHRGKHHMKFEKMREPEVLNALTLWMIRITAVPYSFLLFSALRELCDKAENNEIYNSGYLSGRCIHFPSARMVRDSCSDSRECRDRRGWKPNPKR